MTQKEIKKFSPQGRPQGRPRVYLDCIQRRRNIAISDDSYERIKQIGEGNFSLGVRVILSFYEKKSKKVR